MLEVTEDGLFRYDASLRVQPEDEREHQRQEARTNVMVAAALALSSLRAVLMVSAFFAVVTLAAGLVLPDPLGLGVQVLLIAMECFFLGCAAVSGIAARHAYRQMLRLSKTWEVAAKLDRLTDEMQDRYRDLAKAMNETSVGAMSGFLDQVAIAQDNSRLVSAMQAIHDGAASVDEVWPQIRGELERAQQRRGKDDA